MYDGATPSGNSVAACNLLRLGRITARPEYEALAEGTFKAFAGNVDWAPSGFTQALIGLDFALGPTFEVVVAGAPGAEDTRAMLRALHEPFLPAKVVVFRPDGPDDGEPAIVRLAPYTRAQGAVDGKATAYVCRNYACQAPTTDVATMLEHLRPPAGKEPGD